jgi:hypothetical protein
VRPPFSHLATPGGCTRRIASSSVAPVASDYEPSCVYLNADAYRVSPAEIVDLLER